MITIQTLIDIEARARADESRSRHRRELEELRARRRTRLRRVLGPIALLGWTLAIWQLTKEDVNSVVAVGGAMLSVPFLSTFDLL